MAHVKMIFALTIYLCFVGGISIFVASVSEPDSETFRNTVATIAGVETQQPN